MANQMSSFHITDMIFDADSQTLTYKFWYNENLIERNAVGFTTDEDIISDFCKMLNKYFF